MPQPIESLYNTLTNDGYALGDYNTFSQKMLDPDKAKVLHDTITKDGYQVGDFDSFSSKLGVKLSGVLAPKQKNFGIAPEINTNYQPIQAEEPHSVASTTNHPRQGQIDSTSGNVPVTEIPASELPASNKFTMPELNYGVQPLRNDAIKPIQDYQPIKLATQKASINPDNNPSIDVNKPHITKEKKVDERVFDAAVNSTNSLGGAVQGAIGDYYHKMNNIWGADWMNKLGDKLTENSNNITEQSKKQEYNGFPEMIGGILPMVAATVADVYTGGALTPAIMGTFGVSGYGDGIKAYDDIKAKNGEQGNDLARTGAGLGYSAVMLGTMNALTKFGVEGIQKLAKSSVLPDVITNIFKSNPTAFEGGAKELFEAYAKSQPSIAGQLIKNGVHSVATMEGMELSKLGVNALIGQKQTLKDWTDTATSAAVTGLLFSAVAPFSIKYANDANLARIMAQKEVTISMNGNSPVELIPTKEGFKGLTPDNKLVDVTPEMESNSFTIESNHFISLLKQFKESKTVNPDLERSVFSNRVAGTLGNFKTQAGNIQTITDSEGNRHYISGVDKQGNITGVDGNGDTKVVGKIETPPFEVGQEIPEGRITDIKDGNLIVEPLNWLDENNNPIKGELQTIPISKFQKTTFTDPNSNIENAPIGDVYQSIMNKWDEQNIPKQPEQDPEQLKLEQRNQEINNATQDATDLIDQHINPDTNTLLKATVKGNDYIITKGKLVQKEDGTIDTENSDKEFYYKDENGETQVTPIEHIDGIIENTPKDQAIKEATDVTVAPIQAQHANEDVRPYENGENVRTVDGQFGTITGKTETGYQFEGADGTISDIEPRSIVNEDNIKGLQDGDLVNYTDQNGQLVEGKYNFDPSDKDMIIARQEGISYVDGKKVITSDIQPIKTTQETIVNEVQPDGSTDNSINNQQNNDNGLQENTTSKEVNYPTKKDGTPDFGKMTDAQIFQHTKETKGEEAAQALIGRQIIRLQGQIQDNTRAISKLDEETNKLLSKAKTMQEEVAIQAKQDAKAVSLKEEAINLNAKLAEAKSYLPKVEASAPVEQPKIVNLRPEIAQLQKEEAKKQANEEIKPTEPAINEAKTEISKPKQEITEHQQRIINLNGYIDMEDYILQVIAGGQKFKWKDGLGNEFRNSNKERIQRRNYIDEINGLTPNEFAHQIYNDYGENGNNGEIPGIRNMSDGEIADMVNEVLRTTKSNTEALKQAEAKRSNFELSEQDYQIYESITPEEQNYLEQIPDNILESYLGITDFTPEQLDFINKLHIDYGKTNAESENTSPSERNQGLESETEQPSAVDQEISSQKINTNPTEAQKEAGNYKKGHVIIQDMDITIENPKGSVRSGVDEDGKEWEHEMNSHYGYFKGTVGKDGDHVDTFIGNNPESKQVFVIDQTQPKTGKFDESKVMLGYDSAEQAKTAYLENYDKDWKGFYAITEVGVDNFKNWLYDGKKQHKPFAEYKDTPEATEKVDQLPAVGNMVVKNGSLVTYQGKQYTVNGITADGQSVDLEENGKTVHEDIPVSELIAGESGPERIEAGKVSQEQIIDIAKKLADKTPLTTKEQSIFDTHKSEVFTEAGRMYQEKLDKNSKKNTSTKKVSSSVKDKIQSVFNEYDNGETNLTENDVVKQIAEIAQENNIQPIIDAFKQYQDDMDADKYEFGMRGYNYDSAENFMQTIRDYMNSNLSDNLKQPEITEEVSRNAVKKLNINSPIKIVKGKQEVMNVLINKGLSQSDLKAHRDFIQLNEIVAMNYDGEIILNSEMATDEKIITKAVLHESVHEATNKTYTRAELVKIYDDNKELIRSVIPQIYWNKSKAQQASEWISIEADNLTDYYTPEQIAEGIKDISLPQEVINSLNTLYGNDNHFSRENEVSSTSNEENSPKVRRTSKDSKEPGLSNANQITGTGETNLSTDEAARMTELMKLINGELDNEKPVNFMTNGKRGKTSIEKPNIFIDGIVSDETSLKYEKPKEEIIPISEKVGFADRTPIKHLWRDAYSIVQPKGHPIYNADNIHFAVYKLAGRYVKEITSLKNVYLILDRHENSGPTIDTKSAKEFLDLFNQEINSFARDLIDAKQFSTEPAQKSINDTLEAIEYAKKYYTELSEGKDVWRTDASPSFMAFNSNLYTMGVEMSQLVLKSGKIGFEDYSAQMIDSFGERIKPYLKSFYEATRYMPNSDRTNMTPTMKVDKFDIDKFDANKYKELTQKQDNLQNSDITLRDQIKDNGSTRRNKQIKSKSNGLSLFDNVETGTSSGNTEGISGVEQLQSGNGSSESGIRPKYDVDKTYTNDEIHQIVSSVTILKDDKVKLIGDVTDDIKTIANRYISGGVAKQGRGILDEYYTSSKIVDQVRNLISKYFPQSKNIRVLEPSVGTGNFINAIPTDKSDVVGFEINETTARIAKIFNPTAEINLRSFETEFIDDSGKKKPITRKYNLVVGNPPYGEHRGMYKGLGEESKISKYEDYFVKRSLDVLDEGGILAMVLPSSWMDRHKIEAGYTIESAYRLPSGAFKSTQIGTDIVILKKNSSSISLDPHNYFINHPENVLGEIKERSNRFGKIERYVSGDIDTALEKIEKNTAKTIASELKVEATNDNLNDISESIDEIGTKDKTKKIIKASTPTAIKVTTGKVEIKKGILKYELKKEDEVVPASLQFPNEFTPEQEAAFRDADYSGIIPKSKVEQHKQFANFVNFDWVHDFYYAEGNIYQKLEQLERDKQNMDKAQYDKQKKMLKSVLPEIKTLDRVSISPNTEFVKNLSISTENGLTSLKDLFEGFISKLPNDAFGNSNSWEVIDFVNNNQVYGSNKERNALVRERRKATANDLFKKFLTDEVSDTEKSQIEYAFNREYNAMYRPDYSKVPMFSTINKNFKGRPLQLTIVQRAGIGRSTVKGVGILAHEVGFGKTLSGILAVHEAMTRGTSKKPLIVAPNDGVLKQWIDTIHDVLPYSKINVLGNLGVDYDLTGFKVNDSEITLVTYEGFKAMGFSDDTYNLLSSKFNYITDDLDAHKSERDRQKEKTKADETKGKMRKGKTYNFEDFGFDHLTFDEVHNANHIVGKVKVDKKNSSDFRSQNQRTSDLGIKTWLASQYIQENNDGRNVLLLSATPFTNKPLEYYSILSLVGNSTLERMGFFQVDQFFETFMEADNDIEIKADGTPTQKTNVRRFKNNGLFNQLLSEFIDIKGGDDNPDLVRPERHNREYKIPQNELTVNTIANIQDLFNDTDGVLKAITHSRLVAFSPYASYYSFEKPKDYKEFVENSPKIHTAIQLIEQNKKTNPEGGQLIYSEIGVEFFPMIQEYLVNKSGFKPNEVKIISGATSLKERGNIQAGFNNGEIKVIIGSPAIKEGINLQENTTDMYILSLPYNFTQLRQVEGRSWRQGNKWANIRVNYMLTDDSVDVFMLQRLQNKQGLYNEAMKSGHDTIDVSDIDTSELKTALITDPTTRANIELMIEKGRLESEKTRISSDLAFVHRKYERYNELKKKTNGEINNLKQREEWAKTDTFWARNLENDKRRVEIVKAELEQEKQKLAEKGVNVDDIVNQEANSTDQIAEIDTKIESLKDKLNELVSKYTEENIAKSQKEGDVVSKYIKERETENKGYFYTKRVKDPEFMIMGKRGATSLDKSEEATTRLDNLTVAKEMEATKTPIEIRLATGWEKGVDGLWRYEVSDGDQNKPLSELSRKDYNGTSYIVDKLPNLLKDDELFKAYPELKDVQIVLYSFRGNSGAEFRSKSKHFDMPASITIWGVNYNIDNLSKRQIGTILHEVQHAIQYEEGFAKGGNEDTVSKDNLPDNPVYAKWESEENQSTISRINKITNSPEYKTQLNKSNQLFSMEYEPRIDELDNQRSFDNADEIHKKVNDIFDEFEDVKKEKYPLIYEVDILSKDAVNYKPSEKISKQEAYNRLAGEVEARNASTRMNMTETERREKLLSETADVAHEDQIIIHDGLGVSESRMSKPVYKDYEGDVLKFAEDTKKWYDRQEKKTKKQAEKEAKEAERIESIPIPKPSQFDTLDEYKQAKKSYIENITGIDLNESVGKKTEEVLGKQNWYTFIPFVTEGKEAATKLYEGFASTFIPYKIGKDGRLTKEALQENLGRLARRQDMAEESMKLMKKRFDNMSKFESLEFIDNMERGLKQPTEELDTYAKVLRDALDKAKENVQALGTGKLDSYIENYFPHAWTKPGKASVVLGKRPLEGSKGWMKQRTIEFTKDGVEKGLIPVSWNPVQLAMLKVRDMERYVMAHETFNELKEAGIVVFSRTGKPEGFIKIDDKISEVKKPNSDGSFSAVGYYYAAENGARVINNYLSKGLWGNVVYDTFRGLTNAMTQVQLGLSAFHLGFTTIDATISKVANGIDHLFQLNPKDALKEFVQVPIAAITNPIKGDKLLKAWYGKPSTPEMEQIAKYMEIAGGRAKMDQFYANGMAERIRENVKNHKFITAGLQVPLSILEWTAKPIMEYIVPRQKLGVFADMANEIVKNHPDYTPIELRIALQKAWSSVDNRLGQLVYDNLFWNKVTKDVAMATTRAVGWNLGSIRELGGTPAQAAQILWDALHGRKSNETHKVSYTIALLGMTMLISAIYQYLRIGELPEESKDYFYPKNGGIDSKGDAQRSSMPTYWKDIYAYSQDPIKTATNKLSPVFGMIYQLVTNKDYYGTRIINTDDKAYQIGLDYLNYFKDQFTPFGIRNVMKEDSKTNADYVLPFIGITPAPSDLNMTKAEKRAYEFMQEKLPTGGRTQEQKDESDYKRELTKQLQKGGGTGILDKAIEDGKLSVQEANHIEDTFNKSGLEKAAVRLGYEELREVYKLATEKEKEMLKPIIEDKLLNKLQDTKGLSGNDYDKLSKELDKFDNGTFGE